MMGYLVGCFVFAREFICVLVGMSEFWCCCCRFCCFDGWCSCVAVLQPGVDTTVRWCTMEDETLTRTHTRTRRHVPQSSRRHSHKGYWFEIIGGVLGLR